MKEYLESADEILRGQNASENGLTAGEAAKRMEEHGPNKLVEAKKVSLVRRFLNQLADPMIIVLILSLIHIY